MSRVDRRTFVSLCTTVGLGTAPFLEAVWNQLEATPAPASADPMMIQQQAPSRITREMVTSAETISGLTFTDDERDMMLRGLNGALTSFERIHAVSLPNSVPPALHFSPFPAGMAPPLVQARSPAREARSVVRPKSPEDLAFLTVAELGELVRTRQVTATALTQLYLARLKKYNPVLECVVTLTEDRALAQAAVADREIRSGRYRGPLHGIPWGAKDLLTVPGFKTNWGSAIYQDQVLDDIATVVERLDQAGAILVAKLTLGELAMGDVWFGGTTKNPWLTTQGSSGSSAGPGSATAAGLVGFSIGTETLGSIISPSTRNGVSGLRPTYGRVSR
ncbi:MAG: amidase, partial [Gemmatimonadota bacterium]